MAPARPVSLTATFSRQKFRRTIWALVLGLVAAGCTNGNGKASPPSTTGQSSSDVATTSIGAAAPATTFPAAPELATRISRDWSPLGEPGVGGRLTDLAVDPNAPSTLLAGGDLLGIARSQDRGATWQSTFGLAGSEISRFTFNPARPGEVWAATMSGPHRSLDGGRTWQLLRNGMGPVSSGSYTAPIDRVIVDPDRDGHLWAFGGSHREWDAPGKPEWGAIWETIDSGATWSKLATVAEGTNLLDSLRLPDGTLWVAALRRGLFRSTDGGQTWAAANEGLPHRNVRALAADPNNPRQLWVALASEPANSKLVAGGIYRSTNGGTAWRSASNGLGQKVGNDANSTSRYYTVVVSAADPNVLYTADVGWGSEGIYRSDDGATSWAKVLAGSAAVKAAYGTPPTAEALAADPTDSRQVYAANAEYIVHSTDGGKTWTDTSSVRTAEAAWRGTGFSGLVANRVRFDPKRPGIVVLCAFDGANPFLSVDRGNSWSRPLAANNLWGGCTDAAPAPSGRWFVLAGQGNEFGGVASFDPATGQSVVTSGAAAGLPAKGNIGGPLGSLTVATNPDGSDAVLVSLAGRLYRSVDSGVTFRPVNGITEVEDLTHSPTQPQVVFAATGAGLARSNDGGATFAAAIAGPGRAARLAVDPAGVVYAAVWREQGGGLFRLEPTTGVWQLLLNDPTTYEVAIDPRDPARLLLATNDHPFHDIVTSKGILVSLDGGATWSPFNEGLPLYRVSAVAFDPHVDGVVIAGTFGRGHFVARLTR